jgi:hypothetical protein
MRSEFNRKNRYFFDCHSLGYKCSLQISLATSNDILGNVISVFDSTINIKTINNELLVVTSGKVLSPISMNVFSTSDRTCGFRQLVSYGASLRKQDKETLLIGKFILIDLKKSRIFKNNFEIPSYNCLRRFGNLSNKIFYTLLKTARRGCLLDPDFTTNGLLTKTLLRLQRHTLTGDNKKFVKLISNTLLELCGRGPGYTPSGDDFISGYCILFNSLSDFLDTEKITLPSEKIVNSTTWMSSKFIEYYGKCVVDEQIQEMINSVSAGDPAKYMSLLHQISYRGHTSGADIGIGMTAALYTLIDREFNTEFLGMFRRIKLIKNDFFLRE